MVLTVRRRITAASVAVLSAALTLMVAAPSSGSAGGSTSPTAVVDPALRAVHGTVGVIVQGARSAEAAVVRMGGTITHQLPIVHGFSAKVPASDVDRIARVPGVTTLTLDRATHVQEVPGTYNNLPSVYKHVTRGDSLNSLGGSGQGIGVALIDTGVTSLPDIAGAIQPVATDATGTVIAPCINLTDEPTCDDSYGHGTFMAGLIAGNGASSNGAYVGMAPQAKIISIKIAGRDGSSDVSTVIAAIQWAVSFAPTYNIKVINLSLGTDSTQSYMFDPLDYAVERAWSSGIVVDVAASNRGPQAYTISDPANDPFVITVGAIDDKGTNGYGDDVLPDFSGRGPTATDGLYKPDVVAPGAHLVSLAAPGAAITTEYPPTMPAPYRRGSGTSMANAVVTGLVADMLSLQPTATPDRIKYELMSTAHKDASTDPLAVGAGIVDGYAAINAGVGLANVGVAPSLGTGSIQGARGTVAVVLDDTNSTVLDGSTDLTAQLLTWDPSTLLSDPWTGASWFEDTASGASWFGASWFDNNFTGASWFGASWFGEPDNTEDYGASWFGGAWYGAWDQ